MSKNTPQFQNIKKYLTLTQNDVDPMRHVFIAGDIIYRGIIAERKTITEELFQKGIIDNLINEGLLTPSRFEPIEFNGYSVLVEQCELLSPVSSIELPPSIRRDAGLVLLRITEILDKHDLTLLSFDLCDIFINNTGRPVFYNLDSIIHKDSHNFSFSEFYAKFLAPLRLLNERPELANLIQYTGQISVDEDLSIRWPIFRRSIRWIESLGNIGNKIGRFYLRIIMSPFYGLLNMGRYWTFVIVGLKERKNRKRNLRSSSSDWSNIVIKDLRKHLIRFKFDSISQKWTDYSAHLNLIDIINAKENWKDYFHGPREQALLKVLDSVDKGTVLDVGANNGYFSMLSAFNGFRTTAVDYDIGAIDRLYRMLIDSDASLAIRPLILNFSSLDSESSLRFRADVVFALGFIHHMRLVELLPWSVIIKKLSDLTGKVLVTEYKNNTGASNPKSEIAKNTENDYSLEHLLIELRNYFKLVEVVGHYSQVGATSERTMIVCRR